MKKTRLLGQWGEQKASEFLQKKGLSLLESNFRTPHGEIDLVFWENDILVFVEVKTRKTTDFGMPEESITVDKMEHLMDSIEIYLANLTTPVAEWRVDVITVIGSYNSFDPVIDWFIDVHF